MSTKLDLSTPMEWESPAWDGEAVDISTTDFSVTKAAEARKLWVGGAGTVVVTMAGGTNVTFAGVPAGTMMQLVFTKVVRTGTTATLMNALV